MSEIFVVFTWIGLVVIIFGATSGLTWIAGSVAGDDHDCAMRWLMTCLLYAITTAIFIVYINGMKGA